MNIRTTTHYFIRNMSIDIHDLSITYLMFIQIFYLIENYTTSLHLRVSLDVMCIR